MVRSQPERSLIRPNAESPASLNHWLGEEALNWSGVLVSHIRATFFMEWLLWVAPFVKQAGKVIMPWYADSQYTPVATEDLGRAIAQILIEPKSHVGKTYNLVGPQLISYENVAQSLSRELRREIPYQQIDADQFTQMAGMHSYFRDHVRETAKTLTTGFFKVQNNLIEEITGSASMTIDDFIRKHRAAFVS